MDGRRRRILIQRMVTKGRSSTAPSWREYCWPEFWTAHELLVFTLVRRTFASPSLSIRPSVSALLSQLVSWLNHTCNFMMNCKAFLVCWHVNCSKFPLSQPLTYLLSSQGADIREASENRKFEFFSFPSIADHAGRRVDIYTAQKGVENRAY